MPKAASTASRGHTSGGTSTLHSDARAKRRSVKDDANAIKHFVVDTNVLLHNPNALFVFKEHHVVIPFKVIEELDKMKRLENDLGRSARECIRHLDRLRAIGRLNDGVAWGSVSPGVGKGASIGENGKTGTIRVDVTDYERPPAIADDVPDNHIIAVAWHLRQQGKHAVFVTKDLAARIKSDSLGLPTEDFENQKVNADRLYGGYVSVEVRGCADRRVVPRSPVAELDRLTELLGRHRRDGASLPARDCSPTSSSSSRTRTTRTTRAWAVGSPTPITSSP
jgi:predicted ribonuclease YlaK